MPHRELEILRSRLKQVMALAETQIAIVVEPIEVPPEIKAKVPKHVMCARDKIVKFERWARRRRR